MNKESLFNAIGGADDALLEHSEKAKAISAHKLWIRWGTAAACLCLIVAAIVIPLNMDRGATDMTSYGMYLVGDNLYFVDKGLNIYNRTTETQERISKLEGTLRNTDSGLYFSTDKGIVYKVQGSKLTEIGKMTIDDENNKFSLFFIDVLDNVLYWRSHEYISSGDRETVYAKMFAMNLDTGETKVIFSPDYRFSFSQFILDGKMYYIAEGGKSIEALHINTGEVSTICSQIKEIRSFIRIDSGILVEAKPVEETGEGVSNKYNFYTMNFDGSNLTFLTDVVASSGNIVNYEGYLYYFADYSFPNATKPVLIKCNPETGETNVVVSDIFGTELLVCDGGFYYGNPSYTTGGLYYYDLKLQKAVFIHK